jgi:SAM-dependent methyltransferase
MHQLAIPDDYPWQAVSPVVSDRDAMYLGNSIHYMSVGRSAIENISLATTARAHHGISSILDMPCGHGRVTRVLRASFPSAQISVCDIDQEAVEFCATEFGAIALMSSADFRTLNFAQNFDLIWVGSLITHLPAEATAHFIDFTLRHLSEKGVAVVSSHGAFVAGRIQAGAAFGTEMDATHRMLDDYFRTGYGYAAYPVVNDVQSYGVSLIHPRWLKENIVTAGGQVVSYQDHSWDRHHDVVAFRRAAR